LVLLGVLSGVGCLDNAGRKKGEPVAVGSGTAAATAKADTGIVEGIVVMEGDPASVEPGLASRVPNDCAEALKTYNLVFREGAERRVGDVLVGITGYQGVASPKSDPVSVVGRGCAWDRRTYAMTPAQHLAVKSGDKRPYVPALVGARSGVSLIAVPSGEAVPVYSRGPGQYLLVDEMRNYAQASVFVLSFPTFDVTGLDGKFRIEGVPVGNAKVSAMLPLVELSTEQPITVQKNSLTRVTLKLRFDAAAYAQRVAASKPAGAPAVPPASSNPGAPPSAAPSATHP
jgi:hypothetical protein